MQVEQNYLETWNNFQHTYAIAAKTTAQACIYAYQCDKIDSAKFRKDIQERFKINKGTASKMITAGDIITHSSFELPQTYSNIYELAPVKEDLDNFSLYVTQNGDTALPEMSQKEIRSCVNEYLHKDENVEKVDKKVDRSDPFLADIAQKLYTLIIQIEDHPKVTKQLLSELRVIYERINERSEGE